MRRRRRRRTRRVSARRRTCTTFRWVRLGFVRCVEDLVKDGVVYYAVLLVLSYGAAFTDIRLLDLAFTLYSMGSVARLSLSRRPYLFVLFYDSTGVVASLIARDLVGWVVFGLGLMFLGLRAQVHRRTRMASLIPVVFLAASIIGVFLSVWLRVIVILW